MSTVIESEAVQTEVKAETNGKKTRKRSAGEVYATPKGGFQSSETPGFDIERHNKLKPQDFSDSLDWYRWEEWYFTQRAQASKAKGNRLLAMGATKEERQAKSKQVKVIDSFAALTKVAASDEALKAQLREQLKAMFEALG